MADSDIFGPNRRSRPTTGLRAFSTVAIAVATAGCGEFNGLASEIAHAERYGAATLRRDGAVAYALCREKATYKYLETTLGIGSDGPVARPTLFSAWYQTEMAASDERGVPVSWRSYCQRLDRTGGLYHSATLVVGEYAAAIEVLADAKAFDGSGLDQLGAGLSTATASLGGSDTLAGVAKGLGSTGSKFSVSLVVLLRTRKLRELLSDSKDMLGALLRSLDAYLDALEAERQATVNARQNVLALVDGRRDASGAFTAAAEGALAFDLANDAGRRLSLLARQLASDRRMLSEIASAHAALAAAAQSKDDGKVKGVAASLSRLVADLQTARQEEW